MKTIDRIADEVEAEARAWIEKALAREGPGPAERATFGPWGRVTVLVEWMAAEGWDLSMGRWQIFAAGPSDSHQGGVPRTVEQALNVVWDGTEEVLERMEQSMRWLRTRGVDLRELADEVVLVQVMEA